MQNKEMESPMEQPNEYEWELSKENVQPLRQGRKFSSLSAALQPHSTEHLAKLRQERQVFETEIRMYQGDDPLSTWDRYIHWTEENFPKGGKESNMQELLERCVSIFKDEEKYKNDPRYLNAWLKFANICNDPVEIFQFLYKNGVGTQLAVLYQTWSWYLEQHGNTKRADDVLTQGIENGAQPIDSLRQSHSEFQARVVRLTAGNVADGLPAQENFQAAQDENQRLALGELKGRGKKASVPANRTASVKPSRGLNFAPAKPLQTSQGFQVFCDESTGGGLGAAAVPSADLAAPFSSNKEAENSKKPGKWSNAKMKQKSLPTISVSEVNSVATPSFAVHEDQNMQPPTQTPRKGIPLMNPVLSEKKQKKNADPFYQMTHVQNDPNTLPMYCKHKIYAGTSEISIEELRAAQWMRKATQKQMEAERLAIEQQKEELRRKQEEMQIMQEQMKQQARAEMEEMREILQRERKQLQEKLMSDMKAQQEAQVKAPSIVIYQDEPMQEAVQPPKAEKPAPEQAPPRPIFPNRSARLNGSSINKSITPSSGIASTSNRTPSFFNSSGASGNLTSSGGGKLSAYTPDSSIMGSQQSINKSSLSRTPRGIAAPSPTVNTRLAMQNVMGMFNQTLEVDKNFGWNRDETQMDEFEDEFAIQDDKPVVIASGLPFTIFEEEPAKKPSSGVLEEDPSNKENTPPKGYQQVPKRQGVTSVLQVTRDLPGSIHVDTDKENRVSPVMIDYHMDDDDEEVIGAPIRDWEEKMEAVDDEGNFNPDEMTFAPGYCSTKNFTEAARLASTPYNAKGQMAPLPEPPVSTIKSTCPLGQSTNHPSSLCETKEDNVTTDDMKSSRSSMYAGKGDGLHDLSPIMEQSEDSVKSAASSTSSGIGHEHPTFNSTHHTTHHQTNGLTTLEPITEQQESRLSGCSGSDKSRDSNKSLAGELGNMTCHEIDVTNYIPPDMDEKTEHLLNRSIAIDPRDPFDEGLIRRLVSKLQKPITQYRNYHNFNEELPQIAPQCPVKLGDQIFDVNCMLAEGGYAKVYRAEKVDVCGMDTDENVVKVIKVQKPPCPWEFYTVSELHSRLQELRSSVDVRPSIMSIDHGYFFTDGSCLVNDMLSKGTMLTLVNYSKTASFKKVMPEPATIYLAVELLRIVENMHKCQMIHGDLKPDNLLLRPFPTDCKDMEAYLSGDTKCLKLIDYGRAIDMKLFPEGTTFLSKVNTSGFQCIEMKTDQPWTYQTDYFGLLGTIHVMVFGSYMTVHMKNGRWTIGNTVKRYMMACQTWKRMFDELLNIPSCDELPDLSSYRLELESILRTQVKFLEFSKAMAELDRVS